jgi:magnesium transporter
VAEIAEQLDTDDAVQLIEDLDDADQQAVLAEMEPGRPRRDRKRAVLSGGERRPPDAARAVAVPEHMTVGDLIDYLREHDDLTTEFWEVFVVDHRHHPVGTCQLSWILRTPRHIPLTDVMKRDQTLIPVRHGPGGSRAAVPEIRADLRRRGGR